MLGWGSIMIAPMIIVIAFLWRKSIEDDSLTLKTVSFFIILVSFAVIIHSFATSEAQLTLNLKQLWKDGNAWTGGGVLGGFIAAFLIKSIGKILTLCIFIPLTLIFVTFLCGYTPYTAFMAIKDKLSHAKEVIEEYEGEPKVWHSPRDKKKLTINEEALEPEELEPKEPEIIVDSAVFDEAIKDLENATKNETDSEVALDELVEKVNAENKDGEDDENGDEQDKTEEEIDLAIERTPIGEEPQAPEKEIPPVKEYVFPPLSFLPSASNVNNEDISEEMRSTAHKLVETLRSFKVKTQIHHISRGPSITRYELTPEEGVRVRTIANLVDDISLSLATSGVRIEAPIPGKAAVGIEVPNKNVSIVHLKELLDNQLFINAKSRVTVALGMDVAGTPIYVDIAKMPHLLIAGATGMGKSVCINSMIVSLLYKATPDEVKLILIDPKKVELSMYNGLPHLLIPVVTDPKKAAGSLHWAVTEMDRRFELIEEVGVRDVASYNRITKDDPDKEFLPQIILVIDELADLMMTAPKEVEDAICRIAQKARAAGMHLVIGTQRPSVDVVTGLIKANGPSRIAFTMASQVDSRTIIDIAGAEKLIGRGDMLYAPVGFSKPARVQGAFVTDVEIEKIVNFIKETSGVSSYDASVIEKIEKEALRCGENKGDALGDDGDEGEDPLLRAAIELAIESGKISTSLLQRRLSVGYGRAAKLIDKMQTKGIVSPPEGQKPRTVLITREEYLEMAFKNEE
ncbi:MAG: DUF87 domain-containing protein [Clostridia bacterium]|nr:DUF87 domain-containing protein [Clostridia bacterium]